MKNAWPTRNEPSIVPGISDDGADDGNERIGFSDQVSTFLQRSESTTGVDHSQSDVRLATFF